MTASKERKIGTVISWTTILAQVLISLFFTPFFLKTVGDKEYGLYSFSSSLIAWIDTLVIAIASAYFRFLTREKKKFGDLGEAKACGAFFKIFFVVSILTLCFGLCFDFLIDCNFIKMSEYSSSEISKITTIILMSVLSTSFTSLVTVSKSYIYYKQKYIFVYSISLLQIILQTIFSYIFLKLGFGVVLVSFIHFGFAFLSSIVQIIYSRNSLNIKISIKALSNEEKRYRKLLAKEILVFSSFMLLNTIVDILNKNLDIILLGFYNADAVANYHLALTIPNYLVSITSIISLVYSQRLNEAYFEENGLEKVNDIFLKVSKIQTLITLLLVGGFIACGKEFVFLWLNDSRIEVYIVASTLVLIYSITCSNALSTIARSVQDKHKKASLIYFGIAVFNVVLSLLFLNLFERKYAIYSCLLGTAVSYIIGQWIIMQIYDKKEANLKTGSFFKSFLLRFVFTIFCSVVICILPDLFLKNNNLLAFFIKGFLFFISYACFVFLIDKKDLCNFVTNTLKLKRKK